MFFSKDQQIKTPVYNVLHSPTLSGPSFPSFPSCTYLLYLTLINLIFSPNLFSLSSPLCSYFHFPTFGSVSYLFSVTYIFFQFLPLLLLLPFPLRLPLLPLFSVVAGMTCGGPESPRISAPSDPHVPASLLKLWYRELLEPLIPSHFYDQVRC